MAKNSATGADMQGGQCGRGICAIAVTNMHAQPKIYLGLLALQPAKSIMAIFISG